LKDYARATVGAYAQAAGWKHQKQGLHHQWY